MYGTLRKGNCCLKELLVNQNSAFLLLSHFAGTKLPYAFASPNTRCHCRHPTTGGLRRRQIVLIRLVIEVKSVFLDFKGVVRRIQKCFQNFKIDSN